MLPLRKIEGKYEVVRKLSEGGMGVIYLVRHRQLEELRVIKVLRSSIDAEPDLRARFLREAKSAIQLRHPNIAQLYDFSVDEDGAAYMVMEFIDGVNLEEFCRPEALLSNEIAGPRVFFGGWIHVGHEPEEQRTQVEALFGVVYLRKLVVVKRDARVVCKELARVVAERGGGVSVLYEVSTRTGK